MQPKILDLNSSVNDLLKMLSRLIGEHIQVKWYPHERPVVLLADAAMLDQVLLNLCVNARDAMPSGGTLTIESSVVSLDAEFCSTHAWASPGKFALLQVSDSGIGMDAQTRERIFEPFFTTKGEGKGTGMGLATVYGIVRQHQGMIDVYSEPGVGSQFRVYLPLHNSSRSAETAPVEQEPKGGAETILLAEDEEEVRSFAVTVLQMAGYRVVAARDGLEAVQAFRGNPAEIGLAVLDVVMPRLGGKDAYAQMQAIRPGVPVLYTSGYSKNAVHTSFVLDQGIHLLQKPYTRNALLAMVRGLLDGEAPASR